MEDNRTVLKTIVTVFVLLLAGMMVFLLPIRETDYARLRYLVGLAFFAEAGAQVVPSWGRYAPLYLLVGKHRAWRDKAVAGLALAVGGGLGAWGAYLAICALLGTRELRLAVTPGFLRKWVDRAGRRKE